MTVKRTLGGLDGPLRREAEDIRRLVDGLIQAETAARTADDADHVIAVNPHPQYETAAEAQAKADAAQVAAVSTAAAALTAHHDLASTDHDDRYYAKGDVDAADAAVQAAVDAHVADAVDAHDGTAVSYDGTMLSPVSKVWHPDTIVDVQDSLSTIIAEIDGRIEAGDVTAIIDALNAWTGGDPTLNESGIFSAGIITADAIAAGAVVASKIGANEVTTAKLATDAIKSTNYAYTSGDYSTAGSFFDLANGNIRTPGLFVDGSTGALSVKGDVSASEFTLLNGAAVKAELTNAPVTVSGYFTPEAGLKLNNTNKPVGAVNEISWGEAGSTSDYGTQIVVADGPATTNKYAIINAHNGASGPQINLQATNQYSAGDGSSIGIYHGFAEMVSSSTSGSVYSGVKTSPGVVELRGSALQGVTALTADTLKVSPDMGLSANKVVHVGEVFGGWTGIRGLNASNGNYLLLNSSGGGTNDDMYLRTVGVGTVYIGSNQANTLAVQNGGVVSISGGLSGSGASFSGQLSLNAAGSALLCQGTSQFNNTMNTKQIKQTHNVTAIGSGRHWANATLLAQSQDTGSSYNSAYITMHVPGYAPAIAHYQQLPHIFTFTDTGNTGYVGIYAAAFTVPSTERIKKNIVEIADDDVLGKVKQVKTKKWLPKQPPRTLRPTERFKDINARWVEKGHKPLTPSPLGQESHEHDCGVDNCVGTPESPCAMMLNYTEKLGVIVEEIVDIFPEVVDYDEHGLPAAVDIAQVASLALAAVGALARRVEALEALVAKK